MEETFRHSRDFKRRKQCHSFIVAYGLTDYEVKDTSYQRPYQGRTVKTKRFTVNYNVPSTH